MTIPITPTITAGGAVPTDPATLRANLVAAALALDPGLTANLPGSLIDDIASTDVGALIAADSAYVDLINSITPYTSNDGLTLQLGAIYGIAQGKGFNGSVNVVFSGPVGFVIPVGFKVTDGTNTYDVQDGGEIDSGGTSLPLFCVSEQAGTFPIPQNTVNQLASSAPTTVPPVTCNNPTAGVPASAAQPLSDYRAQVVAAGATAAQGTPDFLKAQLLKVPGVQARLVAVKVSGTSYIISAAGGDPYAMAGAIFRGVADPASLTGSTIGVVSITQANPGVVTTDLAHGYASGQVAQINGATGMTAINGVNFTVTVLTPYSFSIGIDTSAYPAYTGNGVLTPNLRNQAVAINSYPDTYSIPFVEPLQQQLGLQVQWSTSSVSFVSPDAVASLAVPALVAYVNSITTGQPFSLITAADVFVDAVASILPESLITKLTFSVTIAGQSVSPVGGSNVIYGSAFAYFQTFAPQVTVSQV